MASQGRRATRRKRHLLYKSTGRCVCGRTRKKGRARCAICLASDARRSRARYWRRQKARYRLGLCVTCTEPNHRMPGSPYCAYHRELKTESAARVRERNRKRRRCPCGGKRTPGYVYCEKCRTCFRENQRKRRAAAKAEARREAA